MSTIDLALRRMADPLQVVEGGWSRTYTLTPDFPGFAGHFPGHPVVPAVAQVSMVLRTIADACGQEPLLQEIVQAKFIQPITAGQSVTIVVCPNRRGQQQENQLDQSKALSTQWSCTLTCNNTKAAQCRLVLEFPRETP